MPDVSVVVIAKNAAGTIYHCLQSATQVSNNIILVDSGSTDGTIETARTIPGVQIFPIAWQGYGHARNYGAAKAQHGFIFSLDADEVITPQLATAINNTALQANEIYGFHILNFIGNTPIRHGAWANDVIHRIYNKNMVSWDSAQVHEGLLAGGLHKIKLEGYLHHYTAHGFEKYNQKMEHYAALFAKTNNHFPCYKKWLSPLFGFIKNYIFRLGFLDGKAGWQLACAHYRYTKLKYTRP